MDNQIKIISLTASVEFAQKVANILGIEVTPSNVVHFADGEIMFEGKESFRGCNVYIIQSTCAPAAEHLMEVLIAIDACKRGSAKSITCIMPYFGFARQDRKAKPRQPITAKLVADLLTVLFVLTYTLLKFKASSTFQSMKLFPHLYITDTSPICILKMSSVSLQTTAVL